MINCNNKIANQVLKDNLSLISGKIQELYNFCISTEEECYKNPKTYCLYALVSNKKRTIKFETRDVKDNNYNPYNYSTERYLISTIGNNVRKGLYAWDDNKLQNYITKKLEEIEGLA